MRELEHGLYVLPLAADSNAGRDLGTQISEAEIERVYTLIDLHQAIDKLGKSDARFINVNDENEATCVKTGDRAIPVVEVANVLDGIPDELGTHYFWESVFKLAISIKEDARVLLLDDDGLPRAAVIHTALKMVLGDTFDEARSLLPKGLHLPGTYVSLLKKGISEPIAEKDPGIEDTAASKSMEDIFNPSQEELDRFQEWLEAPRNRNRDRYHELLALHEADDSLKASGLRSVFDPLSRQWRQTKPGAKWRAFRALLEKESLFEEEDVASMAIVFRDSILDFLFDYTDTSLDGVILGATLFLNGALDSEFELPVSETSVTRAWNRYNELLDGRKVGGVRNRIDKAHVPILGREHFDSMSTEGESMPLEQKLVDIRKVLDGGISLLDAVMVHRNHYKSKNYRHVLQQLPLDLLALTAAALQEAN